MTTTAAKIIDRELALQQAGGSSELADELFGMLLKELPQFGEAIRTAFDDREWEALQHHVHKLNGATNYCGVPALQEAADRLDSRLKRGETGALAPDVERVLKAIGDVQEHTQLRSP